MEKKMAEFALKVEDNGAIDRVKARLEELIPLLDRATVLLDELKRDEIEITVK